MKNHLLLLGAMLCLTLTSAIVGKWLPAPVSNTEVLWVTDVTDDRKLVGISENVFVGKVVSPIGSTIRDCFPETQFRVQIVQNIKGSLAGTIVVNQEGGWNGRVRQLILDDPLLIMGQTYLFVTSQSPEGWHTPVASYGDIPISSKAEQAALTQRFTEAVAHEIPWPDSLENQ